jgi:hypothetical protein
MGAMSFPANLLDTALMVMSTSARSSSIASCSVLRRACCSSIRILPLREAVLLSAPHNLPYATKKLTDGKWKFFRKKILWKFVGQIACGVRKGMWEKKPAEPSEGGSM